MATDYKTPGVYIEEKNAFPGSAVAVETSVPVFIGYTEKAERNGKSLLFKPTRVTSLAVFVEYFGKEFKSQFTIAEAGDTDEETFMINGKKMVVNIKDNHTALLYNAIRLFYYNGGSACYILSVNTYGRRTAALADATIDAGKGKDQKDEAEKAAPKLKPGETGDTAAKPAAALPAGTGFTMSLTDFTSDANNVFTILEKEYEPTLVIFPDVIAQKDLAYDLYPLVLAHCAKMQSRFGLFDVYHEPGNNTEEDSEDFRSEIGINSLNYGAAYYPFLKTSVVQINEIDHQNLDASVDLSVLLPEPKAKEIVLAYNKSQKPLTADDAKTKNNTDEKDARTRDVVADKDAKAKDTVVNKADTVVKVLTPEEKIIKYYTEQTNYNQSLIAASPTYKSIMEELRSKLNLLPPSAAIAGIFTFVDTTRGVWKSPANVSLTMVNEPAINVSHVEQEKLNVDVMSGKSINVIRPFPGIGTLVWGARTLDGNSQDWRYINVRRTLIMIEQSLKLATRSYVFEPNDGGTWITISSMINNFLYNLWKQGALAGPTPEQAYNVQIGLGSTMTPSDILDGIMRITVMLAIVRPAEFIVLTFQQQQQQA